jgi:hypothetical protein
MENSPASPQSPGDLEHVAARSFVEKICLSYLRDAQNEDGGWGFQAGLQSRTEPTAWALIAFHEFCSAGTNDKAVARGFGFLQRSQLPDGSWPAVKGRGQGCWVTSLACWAFLAAGMESQRRLVPGLHWLCEQWPGDAGLWWRLFRRLRASRRVSAQNDSYYGWSWTPGTASWVEPTSYAVIVLHSSPANFLPRSARRRQRLAEAMLYDRMCPGGGWNCGNPMVYGIPGEPQVSTTVWALLALRRYASRPENQSSLDWLEKHWRQIQSPGSLALAHIALEEYGRHKQARTKSLRTVYEKHQILWKTPEVAWTALALSGTRNWLSPAPSGTL